jgi:hypothetical protein
MLKQIPWPKNWQDFERLCCILWSEIWGDPGTQRNGRTGQPQHGVDIFGRLPAGRGWGGIQCKGRERYPPNPVEEADLRAEVERALNFRPSLNAFILATVAPRDATIQAVARSISTAHEGRNLFSVSVWSWDDISDELVTRPSLIRRLYGEIGHENSSVPRRSGDSVSFTVFKPEAQATVQAAFSHPEIMSLVGERIRSDAQIALTELILNAFEHAGATRCELSISQSSITLRENGRRFDPIGVEPEIRNGRGAGLWYFRNFRTKYKSLMQVEHRVDGTDNVVEFTFSTPLHFLTIDEGCTHAINDPIPSSPLARADTIRIGDDCNIFSVVFGDAVLSVPISFVVPFVYRLVRRLGPDCVLSLAFPQNSELLRETIREIISHDADIAGCVIITDS